MQIKKWCQLARDTEGKKGIKQAGIKQRLGYTDKTYSRTLIMFTNQNVFLIMFSELDLKGSK